MKKLLTLLSLSLSLSVVKADYWTQKANFPGSGRQVSTGFAVNNKGYVSCGLGPSGYLHDLWEYDPATNIWTQKADLPATVRFGATGFSINNKGYVGTGGYSGTYFNDFWEYDPAADLWTQKADFGGLPRQRGAGFSIGTKGYIGCGESPFFNDFWEWDQASNIWTQKSSLSIARVAPVGFAVNGKGYISTGYGAAPLNDLWEYDPVTDAWTQKSSLPAPGRIDASAFSICEKGYLGTGGEAPFYDDFWQYDPVLNQWIQKTDVPGGLRDDCAAFSIGTKGYIGLGQLLGSTYMLDFWEYTPDSACATGTEELQVSDFGFQVSPNPAKDFIVISYPSVKEKITVTISDVEGKKVYETKLLSSDFRLPTSVFQKGIYFVTLDNGKQKAVKKFMKE